MDTNVRFPPIADIGCLWDATLVKERRAHSEPSGVLNWVGAGGRFIGGILLGVLGSSTVAAWLIGFWEWLGLETGVASNSLTTLAWVALLLAWAIGEFFGQTLAANVAGSRAVIWAVAAVHAATTVAVFYFDPHFGFLVGSAIGFAVAYVIKDSYLLFIGRRFHTNRWCPLPTLSWH